MRRKKLRGKHGFSLDSARARRKKELPGVVSAESLPITGAPRLGAVRLPFYSELEDGPEEREIGVADGWRFVIRPAPDGDGFFLWKKSLCLEDHGRKIILEAANVPEGEAERIAQERIMRIVHRNQAKWSFLDP